MQNSYALTASAIAMGLLSFTLSNTPIKMPAEILSDPTQTIYQTTSSSPIANKYITEYDYLVALSPRDEALAFFGNQKSFSDDEIITYWNALESKSVSTGVDIFELL